MASEVALGNRRIFDPEHMWTVALVGHRSAGKTTLAEHLLVSAGVVRRPGRVEQGTTLLDFEEEERRRHCSFRNGYAWLEWGDARIELIDTPGIQAAACDRLQALDAADAVVVVIDATAGVEAGTEDVLEQAAQLGKPAMVVLTKSERVADLEGAIAAIAAELGPQAVPLHLPLYEADELCGVVDVWANRALRYDPEGMGAWSPEPVIDSGKWARAHERLCDVVTATDDDLLEAYLEYFELSQEMLGEGIRGAVARCELTPVLLASGLTGVGGSALMDAIVRWLPPAAAVANQAMDTDGATVLVDAQGPFTARLVSRHLDADGTAWAVFRIHAGTPPKNGGWVHAETGAGLKLRKLYQLRGPRRAVARNPCPGSLVGVWEAVPGELGDTWGASRVPLLRKVDLPQRQLGWSIVPSRSDQGAQEKLATQLGALQAEDGCLSADLSEWPPRLDGLDQPHLERAVDLLRQRTGLRLTTEQAPVRYVETPAGVASGIEGIYVREGNMGLVDEFGACVVDIEPIAPDRGFDCVEDLGPEEAEELPARWRPAIREGIERGLERGPSGFPVVGVSVRLVGGRYDMLSSTEDHFVHAGEIAMQRALEASGTAILEPWSSLDIDVPAAAIGDVITEVSACRGRILSVGGEEGTSVIQAAVPDRELARFPERLSAATGGRGRFQRNPSHYEPLPRHLDREVRGQGRARGTRRSQGGRREAC